MHVASDERLYYLFLNRSLLPSIPSNTSTDSRRAHRLEGDCLGAPQIGADWQPERGPKAGLALPVGVVLENVEQ